MWGPRGGGTTHLLPAFCFLDQKPKSSRLLVDYPLSPPPALLLLLLLLPPATDWHSSQPVDHQSTNKTWNPSQAPAGDPPTSQPLAGAPPPPTAPATPNRKPGNTQRGKDGPDRAPDLPEAPYGLPDAGDGDWNPRDPPEPPPDLSLSLSANSGATVLSKMNQRNSCPQQSLLVP